MTVMSGGNKLKPIYSVDTPEPKIAISFDACWGAEHTPTLLAILKQHNVKTTFFLVNIWLDKYPEVAKTIVAEGHELGLHSASHPDFAKLSEEQMEKELRENKEAIERITGFQPILFRPSFRQL
ncbi:MAG: polysaccharide deacetylase family protein [Bacillota bacterium]